MMLKAVEGAWNIFNYCQTQWRMGFGGPVGLDYTALFRVAEMLGLEVDARCLELIQVLEMDSLARAYEPDAKARVR